MSDTSVQENIDIAPYKAVFDRAPVAFALMHVLMVDGRYDDFVFEYVNKAYEKMSGFSVETLIGHTYSEIRHVKSEQWNTLYGDVAYGGGERSTIEFGPEIDGYVSIQCYQVKEGYCAATVLDITKQMLAERKIDRDFQKKYELEKQRMEHDNSIMAYAVFNLNTHETVEIVRNGQLAPIDEHASLEAFRDDVATCIVQADQKASYCDLFDAAHLLSEYERGVEEQNIDFQRKLPSGKVIWVSARFYLMAEPNGTDVLLSYACRDINSQKALEIMTSSVVDDYDLLAYVNFADNTCVMWYGKDSARLEGTNGKMLTEEEYTASLEWFVNTAVVPEEREQYRTHLFIETIQAELSVHDHYSFQVHVLDAAGRRRTKEIQYLSYDRASDVCMFTQIDITDLLEEKEREQQVLQDALTNMQRANAAQAEFLAKMSHELRTPLNVIIGSATLAADVPDTNAEVREYVGQINYAGQYLLSMINDILDTQRMENGKFTLQNEWVRPKDVLPPALSMMAAEFSNKGIQFVFDENCTIEDDIEYSLDVVRCRQIITNLLNNALKFTQPGGTVTFRDEHGKRTEDKAIECFIVSDTGCGMSAEFQKKMFEPFSQERTAATASVQGTGLGLSVVKQLVDSMDGTIEVESALDVGTTFSITIPFAWRHAASDHVAQERSVDYGRLAGKRVLLVEDHAVNATIAQRLLAKKGVESEIATNGEEGVRLFREHEGRYDAVLMDVRMPVMDGLEAASAIRALDTSDARSIPIIAMTANAYAEDVEKSLAAGMNAHVAKPIDPERLYQVLAQQMR